MILLGTFRGKPWWFKVDDRDGHLTRFSAKEMKQWRDEERSRIERIVARIYNEAFYKVCKTT